MQNSFEIPRALCLITVFAALFCAAAPASASAQEIIGTWQRTDGKSRVSVTRCGEAYCAKNLYTRDPAYGEKVGDVLVMNVKPQSAVVFAGTANHREQNLSLSATLSASGDAMTTRGCVLGGAVCESMAWRRVK